MSQNKKKFRKGNLMITVMLVLFATLMVSSMLGMTSSQKAVAKSRAEHAGDTESYVALANLCADAFKDDLEAQSASIAIVSAENPDGAELTLSVYDDIISNIQQTLVKPGSDPVGENGWVYVLDDPMLPIEYAGLEHKDFRKLSDKLLKDARLHITVDGPFGITGTANGTAPRFETGDELYIDDILFTVILEKGTTQIVQNYRLTGEILHARYTPATAVGTVIGEKAECILESQSVTRNSHSKLITYDASSPAPEAPEGGGG